MTLAASPPALTLLCVGGSAPDVDASIGPDPALVASSAPPEPNPSVPAPAPNPRPAPSTTASSPTVWSFAARLALSRAKHGFDGRLDVYREEEVGDWVPLLNKTHLKLVPVSGAPAHLTFEHAADPAMRSIRFGDAERESLLLQYDHRWVTGFSRELVVVEIEHGRPVWPRARHPVWGDVEPVRAGTTFSGASESHARVHVDAESGAEILHVRCGLATAQLACPSTNRVFYRRAGAWWWDEREGTACRHRGNGWCVAVPEAAPRSDFPAPRTSAD